MMIDTEKWQEILQTLKQHKMRTALTAFGVFWGIFMLSVLLGAGKGLENGVIDDFKQIPKIVILWAQNPTQVPFQGMPLGRSIVLNMDDVQAVREKISSVETVYARNSFGRFGNAPLYTTYKKNSASFSVQGSYPGLEATNMIKITEGRYINERDNLEKRKIAVIGKLVKERLFKTKENCIGEYINVGGINFLVVGVYKSTNTQSDGSDTEVIHMPNDTLRYAFNQLHRVDGLTILPKANIDSEQVENEVKQLLYERKKVSPKDIGVFNSFNFQKEFDRLTGLFTAIQVFSWVVAVGTIFAGAVGVGNIMLIVVKERTREIGLRKALGATPNSIKGMIVQESIFITALAGYFGLVFGVFLLEGVVKVMQATGGNSGMFRNPGVDFQTALSAIIVLIISGIFASLLPAAKAASVNPIKALQDE